tara:strand:+ start:120 stop:578 length:459 start_codon:yes stop_codon:yes gene_type:complete
MNILLDKYSKKKIVKKQRILYNEDWSNIVGCYLKPNWYYETINVDSCYNSTFHKNNHPLVKKGLAFWLNNKLIIGYTLKNNPSVFKSFWCENREKILSTVRVELCMYGRFYSANYREKMVYNVLLNHKAMKKIPETILQKISKFTYDPYLLD